MVKHVVMFRLRGTADERRACAEAFRQALMALPAVIEPLQSIEVGINSNPAETWDVVLTALLPSMADVGVYARHPAHVAAAAIVAPLKADRACVDYEV